MFPLKSKKIVGYRFKQPTFYHTPHLGTDYGNEGDTIFAPFNGIVKTTVGEEGGNTILFYPNGKNVVIRFLHCREFKKTGSVNEGDVIGIVGHTGLVSPPGVSGAHCHIDISTPPLIIKDISRFFDPELFDWGEGDPMQKYIININGTLGVLVISGTSIGGGMAKDPEAFKDLKYAFGVPDDAPQVVFPKG